MRHFCGEEAGETRELLASSSPGSQTVPVEQIGRYQLLNEIARGGMGAVFRAWDPESEREVAIKVLLNTDVSAGERKRFQREVAALTQMRHDSIVAALASGEHKGRPFLVLELVEGPTLEELLRRGPLRPENAIRITHKLAMALQHAHEHGLLHRDVKPSNIILDLGGEPRLTDFGLTKDMDQSLSGTRLTVSGRYMGTPGYWSPEQALGELDALGPATDVYGLGATFYALLTGSPPHGEASSLLEAVASATKDPYPPSAVWSDVDKALDPICLRCLARRPEDRYPSARAVSEALAHYQWGRSRSPKRRWLGLAGGVLVALLAAALGAIAGLWPPEQPSQPGPAQILPAKQEEGRQEAEALHERGTDRFNREDYEGALQDYTRAIELIPSYATAYYSRGVARGRVGDFESAIEDFTQTIRLDPDYALVHNNLALARMELGDFDGAVVDCTRAIELDPSYALTYVSRGTARERLGDSEAAFQDYTRALEIMPADDPNRGQVEAILGEARLRWAPASTPDTGRNEAGERAPQDG